MSAYFHKRHFTPEEAKELLQTVRPQCERLLKLKSTLDELNYNLYKHEYFGGLGPNGSKFHPPELEELVQIMRFFEKEGVVVKSLQDGLIDFPSLRPNGEEVYLCWKAGEDDIAFWHTMDGGFSGRRSMIEW
ncbi:DUF2203 domain-containing protein [bacterium]|nr:MAG: DUF2203 domain-containing protein [bacterium]